MSLVKHNALWHSLPPSWSAHPEDAKKVAGKGYWRPTHARFLDHDNNLNLLWTSRRHRKGLEPRPTGEHASWQHHGRGTYRLIGFDFADISWWVAALFLVGSIFWCINGSFSFLGFYWTANSAINADAATAFIGGTLFAIGGWLSWIESLNPAPCITFAAELQKEEQAFLHPRDRAYRGLGKGRRHFGRHATLPAGHLQSTAPTEKAFDGKDANSVASPSDPPTQQQTRPRWRWYGLTWRDLHSVGYVANTIQLYGAETFWIAVLTGLPGVLPASGLSGSNGLDGRTVGLWDGLFWAPQIAAAPAFFVSGLIFMLEEQTRWWLPNPLSMGWHVGLWNAIGGVGFFLCGVFGLFRETLDEPYQVYGSAFSTFWGSWAFLLGSYLQFLETLNKR